MRIEEKKKEYRQEWMMPEAEEFLEKKYQEEKKGWMSSEAEEV